MRLTLRTMLAYLDNVLDPADAERLGKKINESDFASGLVHRIKGALKKLRMDAPKLDGKGMGNDANTVAEYLDSTLPQDRVGDFERVCLESDKHLCEVAACHQVLALVLGKPADVSVELRERIYALGHPERTAAGKTGERAAAAPVDVKTAPLDANGQAVHPAPPPEVPEYLRRGRETSPWPLIAIAAAVVILGVFALRLLGPFDQHHPLARVAGRRTPAAAPEQRPADKAASSSANSEGAPRPAGATAANSAAETSAASKTAADKTATDKTATEAPIASSTAVPSEAASAGKGSQAGAARIAAAAGAGAAPAASESAEGAKNAAAEGSSAPDNRGELDKLASNVPAARPPAARPPAARPIAPAPGDTDDQAPAVPTARPGQSKLPTFKPVAGAKNQPQEAMEVGRYVSDGQLFAKLVDPANGVWFPKPSNEVLSAGERLISLPAYRPQIILPSAAQLTFAGEGSLRMEEPRPDGIPRVAVEYGRFLVATAGNAGAQVALELVGVKGNLTLIDADSAVAIKTGPWLPPGSNPTQEESALPIIEIYNVNGQASWQEAGKEKVTIPVRSIHIYIGGNPPETHGEFYPPDWVDAKNALSIDRQAADFLEQLIDRNQPLNVSLQEAVKHRRTEVRALASRCLAALGDFDPIVRELSDARQFSYWPGEFDALHGALAHSPAAATRIHETLRLTRSVDSEDLYRLLWGYDPDQLASGSAAQLVRFLESDALDVRVLAFCNLMAITGKTEYYRPERPLTQSRTALQNWKQVLKEGGVAWRALPTPLESYKPIAPPPPEEAGVSANGGKARGSVAPRSAGGKAAGEPP